MEKTEGPKEIRTPDPPDS